MTPKYIGWLPADSEVRNKFIDHTVASIPPSTDAPSNPAVVDFEKAINADPHMRYLFDEVIQQTGKPNPVKNFQHLLGILDNLIENPPFYSLGLYPDVPVGVPFYVFFDLFSNTFAASELFRMPAFNVALKKLLDAFGEFLKSDKSTGSLNRTPYGWFGDAGITKLATFACMNMTTDTDGRALRDSFNTTDHLHTEGTPEYNVALVEYAHKLFNETFQVPANGFQSWDAFFTRSFKSGIRPLGSVPPGVVGVPIYSACESTVFRITPDVKWKDKFWIKETQPYSVRDMLLPKHLVNDEAYSKFITQFENGTVYQAFLSPYDYHHWHSPIDGTIEKIVAIPGSYYAVLPDDVKEGRHGAIIRSQPFLTISATRLLVYIKSTVNPKLVICFIAVGMVEVSTCEVTVVEGAKVKAGDEIGMFHFGGSSSVIVFPRGFVFKPDDGVKVDHHIWLRSYLGVAA